MGKIILICLCSVSLWGQVDITSSLQNNCLTCHQAQQIPNNLIYRRYLLRYSSPLRIEAAMFVYLKNPQKSHSIMPPQFFLKFPMKSELKLDEITLKQDIQAYIRTFDIKKKLRINK